MSLIMKARFCN